MGTCSSGASGSTVPRVAELPGPPGGNGGGGGESSCMRGVGGTPVSDPPVAAAEELPGLGVDCAGGIDVRSFWLRLLKKSPKPKSRIVSLRLVLSSSNPLGPAVRAFDEICVV